MKKKIFAILSCVISLIIITLGIYQIAYNYPSYLDYSNFVLTFEDDFNSTLNEDIWSGHYTYGTSIRKGGYWNKDFAYTKDGNLIIDLKYEENYKNSGKSGWFSAGIDTDYEASIGFNQKYGYFECRCILPETKNAWSAFWLMNDGVYNVDGSGKDGTEIDVFESNRVRLKNNHKITSSLHYDGYGDAHKKMGPREAKIDNNPYQNFNTYGVLWEEDKYTFYVNGKKTFSTNFGGVSQNPEYLILSVEVNGKDGIANANLDKTKTLKENANKYYKLYNKSKTSNQKLTEFINKLLQRKPNNRLRLSGPTKVKEKN